MAKPPTCDYRLVDFGEGRKLEAIGDYLIDRPSPAAWGSLMRLPERWPEAAAAFYRGAGERVWSYQQPWPEPACIDCESFVIATRPTPFGHIGLFPEQRASWEWIDHRVRELGKSQVLNLFAYTGASSLAAAAAGASVTHVDAARPHIEAARENAQLSGLEQAEIRYIIDDVRKYVAREIRRQKRYNLIILDPPAYGHGSRGQTWRLARDLWPLLTQCFSLLPASGGTLLLSGHSPDVGPPEIDRWVLRQFGGRATATSQSLGLTDQAGRFLDAGFQARITLHPTSEVD